MKGSDKNFSGVKNWGVGEINFWCKFQLARKKLRDLKTFSRSSQAERGNFPHFTKSFFIFFLSIHSASTPQHQQCISLLGSAVVMTMKITAAAEGDYFSSHAALMRYDRKKWYKRCNDISALQKYFLKDFFWIEIFLLHKWNTFFLWK